MLEKILLDLRRNIEKKYVIYTIFIKYRVFILTKY